MKKYFIITYYILAAIFAIGMLVCLFIGQHKIQKLFSLGFLWSAAGIFINSKTFSNWIKKHFNGE
jgi:hypothetical protein